MDLDKNIVIYIGKTKQPLLNRWQQHLADSSNEDKVNYLNSHNCAIRAIEDVCEEYAQSTEQFYYELYEETLMFNRILPHFDKWNEVKKATKRANDIIKNMNKKK